MKFNYNLYIENKLNIEKFILLENYIINEFNNKNEILLYYDNNYYFYDSNILDNNYKLCFIENENKNIIDIEKFINEKLKKLINFIENKLNIECIIYLFENENNYNYYEMNLYINIYNKRLFEILNINENEFYKYKILIL